MLSLFIFWTKVQLSWYLVSIAIPRIIPYCHITAGLRFMEGKIAECCTGTGFRDVKAADYGDFLQ